MGKDILFVTEIKSIQEEVRHFVKALGLSSSDIVFVRIIKIEDPPSTVFAKKHYLKRKKSRR